MATETKVTHTPGPWRVERFDIDRGVQIVGGVSEAIGRAQIGGKPQHIVEANARLIAAAPDLLAVARRFIELYDGVRDSVGETVRASLKHAEAIIAKVEGA